MRGNAVSVSVRAPKVEGAESAELRVALIFRAVAGADESRERQSNGIERRVEAALGLPDVAIGDIAENRELVAQRAAERVGDDAREAVDNCGGRAIVVAEHVARRSWRRDCRSEARCRRPRTPVSTVTLSETLVGQARRRARPCWSGRRRAAAAAASRRRRSSSGGRCDSRSAESRRYAAGRRRANRSSDRRRPTSRRACRHRAVAAASTVTERCGVPGVPLRVMILMTPPIASEP